MTANDLRVRLLTAMGMANQFVLMKRGLFYRPEGKGYTALESEAWKLTEQEADKHVYPYDEPVTKHLSKGPPLDDALVRQARAAICTTPERRRAFVRHLIEATMSEYFCLNKHEWKYVLIDATAEQQARALVAVLGEGDANL